MEKYINVSRDTKINTITDDSYGVKIRFSVDMDIEEYNTFRKDGLDTNMGDIKSLTIEFNTLSIQVIEPRELRIVRRSVRNNSTSIDVTISIDYDSNNGANYTLTVGKMLMRDRILDGLI